MAYDAIQAARQDIDRHAYDEAIAKLRAVVQQDASNAPAHRYLGLALASKGEHDEAEHYLGRAAQLAPADPDAHCELGAHYARLGRQHDARRHLSRALELQPDHAGARAALETIGPPRPAAPSAPPTVTPPPGAQQTPPGPPPAPVGDALEGQCPECDLVRDVIDLKQPCPRCQRLQRSVAEAAGQTAAGDARRAAKALEEQAAKYPRHVETQRQLARAYQEMGRHDEALACLERAAALRGEDPDLHYELAYAYLVGGRLAEAKAALDHVLQLQPNHPEAQAALDHAVAQLSAQAQPQAPDPQETHAGGASPPTAIVPAPQVAPGTEGAVPLVIRWQEWLKEGWSTLTDDIAGHFVLNLKAMAVVFLPGHVVMLLAGIVAAILAGGVGALWSAVTLDAGASPEEAMGAVLTAIGALGVAGLVLLVAASLAGLWAFVASVVIGLGYQLVYAHRLETGRLDDSLLWKGRYAITVRLLLYILITTAISWVAGMVPLLPYVVNAFLWFAGTLVVLGGRDAIPALQESYEKVKTDWLQMIVFLLVLTAIGLAVAVIASPLVLLGMIPLAGILALALVGLIGNWTAYASILSYRDNFAKDGLAAVNAHPELRAHFPTPGFARRS